jgi:hypothetical protein
MKTATLLLVMLALPACTIHPMAYNPGTGEFVSTGSSLATRSTQEGGFARTAAGTELGYYINGKDETVVPRAYFWERGITSVAGTVLNGFRTAQSTERILSGHSVQRAGIRAARDVRLAEIAVPPVTELPVAAAAAALP